MTMMTSHSIDFDKLNFLILEKYEVILDSFNLNLITTGSRLHGNCPIHGGDNPCAFNMYLESGAWQCYTGKCEKKYGGSILGFVRGLLSVEKRQEVSWGETVKFCKKFLGGENLMMDEATQQLREANKCFSVFNGSRVETSNKINRERVRGSLQMPAEYFLGRGFDQQVLDKFDVGLCTNKNKPMYDRAVVPVYDGNYNYVGCIGRSIYDKCEKCSSYHSKDRGCPQEQYKWQFAKWRNNDGFEAKQYLYNYNNAKEHILNDGVAIIVEGSPNCWKLEQNGIYNSVGTFGADLSEPQKRILDGSGAMSLVVMTDNDDAGFKAAEKITEMCHKQYRLYFPKFDTNDVAQLTNDKITNDIKPIIDKLRSF